MTLLETYNESIQSPKDKLDNLLKNGISLCGATFNLKIRNSSELSAMNLKYKYIVIALKSDNFYSDESLNKIFKIIEEIKKEYLKDVVIIPTVKKYSKLMEIDDLLEKINIVPIIQNNNKILATCKVDDDSFYTLTFSTKLIEKLKPLVEYIVIHELCHAKLGKKDGTHTEEFWKLLEKYSPHYKDYAVFLNASSDFID